MTKRIGILVGLALAGAMLLSSPAMAGAPVTSDQQASKAPALELVAAQTSPAPRELERADPGRLVGLESLLGLGLFGLLKIPVRKNGDDGIEHWSHDVTPDQAAGVVSAVCDGKHWHLYKEGDELAEAHTPEQLHRNADAPAAAKTPAPAKKKK